MVIILQTKVIQKKSFNKFKIMPINYDNEWIVARNRKLIKECER